jgi:hypothetical protein
VGTVDSDINMHAENERVKTLGSQALTINTLTSAGTGVTGTGTIPQDLGVVSNNDSLVSQLSQMANSSVTQSEKDSQILPAVIPGFTVDNNASNINSIVPSSE